MASSANTPNELDTTTVDVWSKGYVSLNQVSGIMKSERPLVAMSYPAIRQAVTDKALKVLEIGNQMRVTRPNLEAFYKVVEDGLYRPSSKPEQAHWVTDTVGIPPADPEDPKEPEFSHVEITGDPNDL